MRKATNNRSDSSRRDWKEEDIHDIITTDWLTPQHTHTQLVVWMSAERRRTDETSLLPHLPDRHHHHQLSQLNTSSSPPSTRRGEEAHTQANSGTLSSSSIMMMICTSFNDDTLLPLQFYQMFEKGRRINDRRMDNYSIRTETCFNRLTLQQTLNRINNTIVEKEYRWKHPRRVIIIVQTTTDYEWDDLCRVEKTLIRS